MNFLKKLFKVFLSIMLLSYIFLSNTAYSRILIGNMFLCDSSDLSVSFDGNQYFLKTIIKGKDATLNEYVPKGSTVLNWKTMITLQKYPYSRHTKAVKILAAYIHGLTPIRSGMLDLYGNDPDPENTQTDDNFNILVKQFLVGPDPNSIGPIKNIVEYVLARASAMKGKPTRFYIYSYRLPKTKDAKVFEPIVANLEKSQDAMMKELWLLKQPFIDYDDRKSIEKHCQ